MVPDLRARRHRDNHTTGHRRRHRTPRHRPRRREELCTGVPPGRFQLEHYPPVTVDLDDESGKDLVYCPVALLFTTGNGTPVTSGAWSVVWRAAVKRAKLPATGFTLHSLRHYSPRC